MIRMSQELNIIKNENKEKVKEILVCYNLKPDIPYKHIECTVEGHHVDFTYKTHYNFSNSIHSTMHSYTLYIGTQKSTENDLRRLM